MDNPPASEPKETTEPPAPEVLQPRSADSSAVSEEPSTGSTPSVAPHDAKPPKRRRNAYKPSHKATFIGLSVVAAILVINAGVITFLLKSHSTHAGLGKDQVVISQSVLDRLGVNRSSIGDSGVLLTIGPNSRFNGKVDIAGDVSIGGQLKLNNQFSAPSASFAQLQAGNTSLSQLNVNGDTTLSKLNLRSDLAVTGTSHLQGAVTVSQLFTVNNSANISGNLGVGGTLSVGTISTRTLTITGHIVTAGNAPSVSAGAGIGSNGTVSISGNDTAGTVAVNIGAGSPGGALANITFRSTYGSTPHVTLTPVNHGMSNYYVTRSAGGFSIGVTGAPSPGGYAFDYIVAQ